MRSIVSSVQSAALAPRGSSLTLFRYSRIMRSCDICLDADAAAYCSVECAHAAWPAHWPACCPQIDQCVVVSAEGQRDETREPKQHAMQWQSNGLSRSSDDDNGDSALAGDEVKRMLCASAAIGAAPQQRSRPSQRISRQALSRASVNAASNASPLLGHRRAAAADDAIWPTLCATDGDIWRTRRWRAGTRNRCSL